MALALLLMVYREGKLLAVIGIPIGLIIGNIIGYFLIPDGWYWLTTLCVTIGVGLFSFIIVINLVNTTITNFLSRRQEIGMLQAIGLSKKQLIKMLCYEWLVYSVFVMLVTLILGSGLGFLCIQAVAKTVNPYFYYSFPWLVVLIYLAILLIVQFILISYTNGNLKKQSLVEQIRVTE